MKQKKELELRTAHHSDIVRIDWNIYWNIIHLERMQQIELYTHGLNFKAPALKRAASADSCAGMYMYMYGHLFEKEGERDQIVRVQFCTG